MIAKGPPSMENKIAPANEPEAKPAAKKGAPSIAQVLKESRAEAWKLSVSSTDEEAQDPGNARQVLDGSLIGTCLLFFAAMLSIQHLDTSLTVASVAFA